MGIIGKALARLTGGTSAAPPRRRASAFGFSGFGRSYNGASLTDPDLSSWGTANPSPQVAIDGDRNVLAARIHDTARNNGWASGAVTRQVDDIIGSGWKLTSKPNYLALGLELDQVHDVAAQMETAFDVWARNIDFCCDAGERLNWGGLLALSFRHRIWDGEAIAAMHWIERAFAYSTAVEIIHPDRLSNPNGAPDTPFLRGGIELGSHQEPLAYHFRGAHPGDGYFAALDAFTWTRVPRNTPWGRRQIVHAFEPGAAGQYRGVSAFATVLKEIRMESRYKDVEMQAAMLNAIMAAFVTSPFDGEQLAASMSDDGRLSSYQNSRLEWHEGQKITLGGAKINFLAAGEKLQLTNPNHPNSVFEAFQRTCLRNIAAAIGSSYEQVSMDWSQVNYSSARAALLEIYRGFTARKDNYAAQFAQQIYACVIEEAIDRGDVVLPTGAPGFYEAKTAWCQNEWLGPARGWVDPQKEALAAGARLEIGVSSLQDEAAEQGKDWRALLQQQSRENKEREKLGLQPLIPNTVIKALAAQPVEEEEPKPGKKQKEPA